MAARSFSLKALLRALPYPHTRKSGKTTHDPRFRKYSSLPGSPEDLRTETLAFEAERVLLRSSSFFPYFMLVAFEAGGPLRALALLLFYPLVCFVGKELGLKIMVFLCFSGIKEERFRVWKTVLPKFFLEDVGEEGFDVVTRFGTRVAVTALPCEMVSGFLKDYIGVEAVVGRRLEVVRGYYTGFFAKATGKECTWAMNDVKKIESSFVEFDCNNKALNQLFSCCKEIYTVSEAEKRKWKILPREKYAKPLIFHDGRLAFKPTVQATVAMLTWVPLGLLLFVLRSIVALTLPYKISVPLLSFTGTRGIVRKCKNDDVPNNAVSSKGTVYACNHRTLLDPIYISMGLMRPVSSVTYSLSRVSALFSPLRIACLTRNKEEDYKTMKELLSYADLVVCPEGTTCREPYLLRFSPLFAELSDEIVPVAIDVHVSMFYGTTASGLKVLDPFFYLLNPYPTYSMQFLKKLPRYWTCGDGGKSKIEVANLVQKEVADALGFECTSLTRKDKYMILAGNEGIV